MLETELSEPQAVTESPAGHTSTPVAVISVEAAAPVASVEATPTVVPARTPITEAVPTLQAHPIEDRHVLGPSTGTKRKIVSVGSPASSTLDHNAGPAKKFCGVDIRILALREEEEEDSESDTDSDEGGSGRGDWPESSPETNGAYIREATSRRDADETPEDRHSAATPSSDRVAGQGCDQDTRKGDGALETTQDTVKAEARPLQVLQHTDALRSVASSAVTTSSSSASSTQSVSSHLLPS